MSANSCRTCPARGVCRDCAASWFFFVVGLIATVALRVIEPLNSINPLYGKIAWYVGISGFILFFLYKYRVLQGQSRMIEESGLKERLSTHSKLSRADFELMSGILCSQYNWKERVSFIAIFGLSAVALAFALYKDLA
jgi:hypothetical protein